MTAADIAEAETNPVEFLYPCITEWTAHIASSLHRERNDQKYHQGVERSLTISEMERVSLGHQLILEELSYMLRTIRRFNGSTSKAKVIISDLEELLEWLYILRDWNHGLLEHERDITNLEVSNLAIEESRKSIEQAVSVKRR